MLNYTPALCIVLLFFSLAMAPLTLATDFAEMEAEYRKIIKQGLSSRNYSDPHRTMSFQLYDLWLDNDTCAFGRGSGRYNGSDESFVYVNGVEIPEDAVNFAGVFDTTNVIELAMFRGRYPCVKTPDLDCELDG